MTGPMNFGSGPSCLVVSSMSESFLTVLTNGKRQEYHDEKYE